jgi:hypothetical protein
MMQIFFRQTFVNSTSVLLHDGPMIIIAGHCGQLLLSMHYIVGLLLYVRHDRLGFCALQEKSPLRLIEMSDCTQWCSVQKQVPIP